MKKIKILVLVLMFIGIVPISYIITAILAIGIECGFSGKWSYVGFIIRYNEYEELVKEDDPKSRSDYYKQRLNKNIYLVTALWIQQDKFGRCVEFSMIPFRVIKHPGYIEE